MERPLIVDLFAALGLFFAWTLAQLVFPYLDLPPIAAALQVALVGLLFAWRYVLPGADPMQEERRARSRVRPLGAYWPSTVASALAVAVAVVVVTGMMGRLLPAPDQPDARLAEYLAQPLGELPFFAGFVLVDPLVSEVIFRGWVQGRLERAFGPEVALVNGAALFAIARLDLPHVPTYFLLGLACGYSVYLTRSIWSAVIVHFVFQAVWYAVDAMVPSFDGPAGPFGDARGMAGGAALIAVATGLAIWAFHRQQRRRDAEAAAEAGRAEAGAEPPRAG